MSDKYDKKMKIWRIEAKELFTMGKFFTAIALFVSFTVPTMSFAQTTTIAYYRMGVGEETTYHYAQSFQVRDRWIAPDVGYIDFARTAEYREWFVGGGYKLLKTKHVTVAGELYFVQAAGPASAGAKYVEPFTGTFYTFTPRWSGETVILFYVPLDNAGLKQVVLERTKIEYGFAPAFKLGVGYGAYQAGDEEWQNKPFITATLRPFGGKFGSFELWLQKLPGDKSQVQIRYELVHVGNKK
jgi:hypothetical protein